MLTEYSAICSTKLCHQFFLFIVCDDSYFHFLIPFQTIFSVFFFSFFQEGRT
jgi:hypothetical protein